MQNNLADRVLTVDELRDLTGYKRPHEQCRTLQQMGIRFFRRPDGKPAVVASALGGSGSTAAQPDFSALDRGKR